MELPPTPISPTHLTANFLQCSICKKIFKSKRGLSQHQAIIRRYNLSHEGFYKLPKKFINEFKKTLVFLVHRQLPCHYTKMGLKAITVACTKSQFFATFNGHIHHYSNKTCIYKCIFGGPDASSKLAQIFNNTNWGTKFYHGNEETSVLTNLDDMNIEEESPLDRKRKSAVYTQKKSRYKRGEVVIEWKPRQEKDIKGNKCEGGFLYMHFWITKRRII
jgi:hypothetical protein